MAGKNGKTTLGISDLKENYYKTSNEVNNEATNLSLIAYRVYGLFRGMVNEKKNGDEIWPSYTYIQKMTHLSRRTVAKAINELIESGWISGIDKGFNSVNHYHINETPRVNSTLLQSRARSILGHEVNSGRARSKPQVGHEVNSNKTNITRLINNTVDLKIKNFEDRISDLGLKTDEERKQKMVSLTQLLREAKYRKDNDLPDPEVLALLK